MMRVDGIETHAVQTGVDIRGYLPLRFGGWVTYLNIEMNLQRYYAT
jgi:hypothetical protein